LAWLIAWLKLTVSHRQPVQSRISVADETTEKMRQTFVVRSPRKSSKPASLELNLPKTTVWKIMKERLRCKPYSLQLVQALSLGDEKRIEFGGEMGCQYGKRRRLTE